MTQVTKPTLHVVVVAYAIEAGKGSESGSGYNFCSRLAKRMASLTLITRRNNAELLRADPTFARVHIIGYDLPRWTTFWKRKTRGVIAYYYFWQRGVGALINRLHKDKPFDIVHLYNFHTDWAPHFVDAPAAKVIWGPICHQPRLPKLYFLEQGRLARVADFVKWQAKSCGWRFSHELVNAIRRTNVVLYANNDIAPPFEPFLDRITLQTFGGSDLGDKHSRTLGDGPLSLLHVGRMVPIKGAHIALRALARHLKQFPRSATLTLIGDGPLRKHIEALVLDLKITESVIVVPWIDRSKLHYYYEAADVFLYPSFGNQDTVVAEALHADLPVITCKGTGSAFMAGEAGFTVPNDDNVVDSLAAAITYFAHAKRNNVSAFAEWRARAALRSRTISWDHTVEGILRAYGVVD